MTRFLVKLLISTMLFKFGSLKVSNKMSYSRLLYISTSVWVLRTPNAGQNGHFQRFLCKKPKKKQEICSKF